MKRFTLAMLAGTILLSGCASNSTNTDKRDVADRGYTPVGTNIPRKNGEGAGKVATLDQQALENERLMNNGTINLPQR